MSPVNERDFRQEDRDALRAELERMGPVATFPWHTQQEWALRAATDVVQINGGNQSGKSLSGIGIVSRLVRREGPIYRRLRDPEKRTLLIWVAPKTLEKYLSIWEPRILDTVFKGMKENVDFTYRQNPFPEWTWYEWRDGVRVEGGKIIGKAQKQGFMAFESDPVDLIIFDEEPEDPRLMTSAKARFSTTNGVLVLCFTPLLGMSFTYHQQYAPTVKPENQIADRVWQLGNAITVIEMGMADNPASVAGGGVKRMQDDPSISDAEKNARLYGKYGYTEGLLFPMWAMVGMAGGPDIYMVGDLPKGRPYAFTLTADPNKRHGALLTALDPAGNRFYCSEHYAADLPDSQHAAAYRRDMLAPWDLRVEEVQVFVDPGGAGAQAMLNLAEYGIMGAAVRKDAGSVAASVKRLRGAAWVDPSHPHPVTGVLGAPRVYFVRWNPLTRRGLRSEWIINNIRYAESRLQWELRQYRQEEEAPPDTPVKALDDVVDCARYFELARQMEPTIQVADERAKARMHLDELSRTEAKSFDEISDKAEAQYRNLIAAAQQRFIGDLHSVLNSRR